MQPCALCLSPCRGLGKCLADAGRRKMLGSDLKVVAEARSLGLGSAVAVAAPRFFSCSLWIKRSAQDCQNPSCHGEGNRLRGCYTVYKQERGTKRHFALTSRTIVFTQQFLVSYLCLGMFMSVSYLQTICEQHRAHREACYRTTYFMSVHARSALGSR